MKLTIDRDRYVEFCQRVYPKKKHYDCRRLIDWRLSENPYNTCFHKGLLVEKDDIYIGQIMPIYSQFLCGQEKYDCVWGSDYIVQESYRDTSAGVKVLSSIVKNYMHFGVGMSPLSLKMHQILKEREVCQRYHQMVLPKGRKVSGLEVISLSEFLECFERIYKNSYMNESLCHFGRSIEFYNWLFKYTLNSSIQVLVDSEYDGFVVYKKNRASIGMYATVIDFSPSYFNAPDRFAAILNSSVVLGLGAVLNYAGTLNMSNYLTTWRERVYPVYSNCNMEESLDVSGKYIHVTGLDSDRYLSNYLWGEL